MLPQEDGGVVGPDLIVHGTCNLRVVRPMLLRICQQQPSLTNIAQVDASIIPFVGPILNVLCILS